jgi:hypothetical protein
VGQAAAHMRVLAPPDLVGRLLLPGPARRLACGLPVLGALVPLGLLQLVPFPLLVHSSRDLRKQVGVRQEVVRPAWVLERRDLHVLHGRALPTLLFVGFEDGLAPERSCLPARLALCLCAMCVPASATGAGQRELPTEFANDRNARPVLPASRPVQGPGLDASCSVSVSSYQQSRPCDSKRGLDRRPFPILRDMFWTVPLLISATSFNVHGRAPAEDVTLRSVLAPLLPLLLLGFPSAQAQEPTPLPTLFLTPENRTSTIAILPKTALAQKCDAKVSDCVARLMCVCPVPTPECWTDRLQGPVQHGRRAIVPELRLRQTTSGRAGLHAASAERWGASLVHLRVSTLTLRCRPVSTPDRPRVRTERCRSDVTPECNDGTAGLTSSYCAAAAHYQLHPYKPDDKDVSTGLRSTVLVTFIQDGLAKSSGSAGSQAADTTTSSSSSSSSSASQADPSSGLSAIINPTKLGKITSSGSRPDCWTLACSSVVASVLLSAWSMYYVLVGG